MSKDAQVYSLGPEDRKVCRPSFKSLCWYCPSTAAWKGRNCWANFYFFLVQWESKDCCILLLISLILSAVTFEFFFRTVTLEESKQARSDKAFTVVTVKRKFCGKRRDTYHIWLWQGTVYYCQIDGPLSTKLPGGSKIPVSFAKEKTVSLHFWKLPITIYEIWFDFRDFPFRRIMVRMWHWRKFREMDSSQRIKRTRLANK